MDILLISFVIRCIFGAITNKMNQEKGYENGFWWGFFLGVLGIIIIAVRPYRMGMDKYGDYQTYAAKRKELELYTMLYRDGQLTKEEYENHKRRINL